MQHQAVKKEMSLRDCGVYDPISQKTFYLQEGNLCVKSQKEASILKYDLPQHFEPEVKRQQMLRFKKIINSTLSFSPSGRSVTCKSDKIHEVDMNACFTTGVAMWSISCSSNCLSLIVGVKNIQKKKEHSLQFTIQNTTQISFKLDIAEKKLKAWINKPLSISQKKVNLSEDIFEWTPFLRVKGVGITVFLSSLVEDPQNKVSPYNVFRVRNTNVEPTLELTNKPQAKSGQQKKLKLIDENTLMVQSKQDIKLIRRSLSEKQFNLNFSYQTPQGLLYIEFSDSDIHIFNQVGFKIGQGEGKYACKSVQEWTNWMISSFTLLDTLFHSEQKSKQLCHRAYEILLSKIQTFKPSIKQYMRPSAALQSDIKSCWSYNQSLLPHPKVSFTIPNSIRLNNQSSMKFQKDIKAILWTENFLVVQIAETQRLVIINKEDTLFKLAEINIKKGFKKQYQLNQYQKQLDQLQIGNANEPSIYKILKNCLRYADKIKLPEKQIKLSNEDQMKKEGKNEKQARQSKEQKKIKKADGIIPNKSLVNTLIGMGFNESQANSALVEAKNNLQKAIQLIFSQPQIETPKSAKSAKTWDCQQCTLINNDSQQTCNACGSPKPVAMEQIKPELEPIIKQVQQERNMQENVESKSIETELKRVFAWQLGFAYSPLVIAGAFEGKLRVRLLGPNPKYYSIFYHRDEEFVDLTDFTIHDQAYKINQKPVRHLYYLNSTTGQQKQSAYGWISIEDEDIEVNGIIQNVTFHRNQSSKETISFTIDVELLNNGQKSNKVFKGIISIDKIYAEKKKSLKLQAVQKKIEEEQSMKKPEAKQEQKERVQIGSDIIPKNGFLQLRLSRKEGIKQVVNVIEQCAQVFDKIHQTKPYLPIVAAYQQGSAQITTLTSSIRPGQKPLVMKTLSNKSMSVEYVVLQKIGKHTTNTNYKGYIQLVQDPSKVAVRKVKFNLEKGKKKFYIETKQPFSVSFVRIVLQEEKQHDSSVIEQISLVGVIGQQFPHPKNKKTVRFSNMSKLMKLGIKQKQGEQQSTKFKIQTVVINSSFDLGALSASRVEQTVQKLIHSKTLLDLSVKIHSLAEKDLVLQSFDLEGWEVIRKKSHWSNSSKVTLLQQHYKQILQKFLETCDIQLLEILMAEQNKDYFKTIINQKHNLTEFIKTHVLDKPIDRLKKIKLEAYFKLLSPYLHLAHKEGNLQYAELLKSGLGNQGTNIYSLEFLFGLTKYFTIPNQIIISDFAKRLEKLIGKDQNKVENNKRMAEQSQQVLSKNNKNQRFLFSNENIVYNRYLIKSGKMYKKYTFDLLNVYRITNFALTFEKSNRKSIMRIVLKSLSPNEEWITQYEENHPQYVWEQLAICPFTQQFEKNIKQSKRSSRFNCLNLPLSHHITTRFVQLEICFSAHPNIGSIKEIQRVPQSQIIPEIHGQYLGESADSLQIFKTMDLSSLAFIKNVNGVNKYNVKNKTNLYYYDNDQSQNSKNQNQAMSAISSQKQQSTPYIIACIQVDQLISKGGEQYSQEFISSLLAAIEVLERGPLLEKIVLLLRKIAKTDQKLAIFLFKRKFPTQHTFNSIFKESCLNSESVIKILQGSPTKIQFQNAILLARSQEKISKDLSAKILKYAVRESRIDDTIALQQKHGWIEGTTEILDVAIKQNKQNTFKKLIGLCHDNKQLCNYTKSMLQKNGINEWSNLAFQQIVKDERIIKESEISELLKEMIKNISSSIDDQDSFQESQIVENFINLTTALSKLEIQDKHTLKLYIDLFSKLPRKESVINKFISLKQLKSNDFIPQLLNVCLKMLNGYVSNNSSNQTENLSQVYEILVFIFRNDSNNNQWVHLLNPNDINTFCQVFSSMLIKDLCIGGQEASKIVDSDKRFKLSLIFCLSTIANKFTKLKSGITISEKYIRNLYRWIIFNSSANEQNLSSASHFTKIEEAAWQIILCASSKLGPKVIQIFKDQFEKQDIQISKIRSSVQRKIYEKKLLNICVKYLSKIQSDEISYNLIEAVYSKFMQRIIGKNPNVLESFDETSKGNANSKTLIEKEYANSFQLQSDSSAKPKDWLIHKNGAKNSVFKFDYSTAQQSYEILLRLNSNEQISLSKILIGFEQLQTTKESYGNPREITVEGGSKLSQLKFIGKMTEIPDNHYINFSVRVYGLNCQSIQANRLSASLNKYPDIKYLKLTLRCPESGHVSQALNATEGNKGKTYGSSINFLSIQGYSTDFKSHTEMENILSFIKKISQFRHKQSLKKIFNNEQNVRLFKDSLINLSLLMRHERFADDIHKFIMRVCQVNTQIGNQTIDKYLHLGNSQTCANIVSEVILSNQQSLQPRILILHKFIIKNLAESKQVAIALEPFLNKFCQILYTVEKSSKKRTDTIKLSFNTSSFCSLIKSQSSSQIFAKYLCAVMKLQFPFESVDLDHSEILKTLKQSTSPLSRETLETLVVSDKASRSWYMQNNYLQELYNGIIKKIKSKQTDASSLRSDIETLGSLCLNSNMKSIINKNKYNIDIFNLLVSDEFSDMLALQKNNDLRQTFVNFINKSVLGSENEKVVAEILKSSLASSTLDQNKFFVGQVFLPILNGYAKSTICMHPYDAEQSKVLLDINIKNQKDKGNNLPQANKNKQIKSSASSKFRLPTNLLNNAYKLEVLQKIKQKTKIYGGNFNLAANHGSEAFGMFDAIFKTASNNSRSMLFLFKTISNSQKPEILGIFYKELSEIRKLPINWNDQCFMFIAKQNEPVKYIDSSRQSGKKFLAVVEQPQIDNVLEDYGEHLSDRVIQMNYQGVPFCQIYSSNIFGSSYINLDILRGTAFGNYTLESAEYWLFDPTSETQSKNREEVSLTQEILNLYSYSFFEPQFESKSVLRLLRYDKIYEFPSSLTTRELKLAFEIMKCKLKEDKQNNLKIRTMDLNQVPEDTQISTLTRKEEDNPILDLLCQVNSIGNMLDYSSHDKANHTSYLPKRGVMKHFEEINGVTSMIKVIKKSLESWKNKQRKQKWYQYVLELQKFSSFPHFFGMYLKDSQTFDLLFKLLSGLPDTEQDKKWDELQSKSTQKLLKIISQILIVDKTTQFRQYAMKHDFFKTILERLKILTGLFKRQWKQVQDKDEEQISPTKTTDDDGTKQIKKKKGVGYGNDGSSNTKWMKGSTEAELMKEFEVIQLILNIIENFLDLKHWSVPKKVLQNIYESALLPYLEDSLRAGTLLQISKIPAKFKLVFKMLRTFSKNPHLIEVLMPINKYYQPKQIQSLQSLLKSLDNTANIFLSCLKSSKQTTTAEKVSEQLAKDIIATSKLIEEAIDEYVQAHQGEGDENQMKNILDMPLDKKYRLLLKDLRFDYVDMKEGAKIKHHYQGNFNANYTPNQNKMIRLAQQLADISTALPHEHTNAIFVRCDKDRVDFMQALIMGSNGTPYGHGAYLFDVYFDDTYPNSPPKVNLTTTGHGKVRFNPNLYACGKVCLSLLGTWRGSASQNWDAKVSTLLQVLVSIQAIIMSEQVYFNEPGFEGQQGTPQGQKKNQAYSNIVRYCNIKFAMVDNMKNPPKGFEHVIKRHFYLKQHEIMDQCKKWLLYAEKRPANYIGLVNDHNNSWSTEFKKSKNQYKDMLQKAIEQLDAEFKKLPVPSIHDITSRKTQKKQKRKVENVDMLKKLEDEAQQEIDVAYDKKENMGGMEIDINDEKVKDRWSRYIGAMGIDAVGKQSKADILVFGLGPASLETVKNLVLSGCRKLTIVDEKQVRLEDLSGGFFYTQSDIGKKRTESILYKIRQLNAYVKIDSIAAKDVTQDIIKTYTLVFVTELPFKQQFKLNEQCRAHNVKFISAQFRGVYCRIINDFGDKFEVLDKNGQEPVELIIKEITCAENGVVTLLDGSKHPFQDGEVVHIKNVEGMAHKEDKSKSINGTLHKVKVINSKSFEIGDTTVYEPYIRNGTVKNVKTPLDIKYQSMREVYEGAKDKLPIDENLQFYDFSKMSRNKLIHFCFATLDLFIQQNNGKLPLPWDVKDATQFLELFSKYYGEEVNQETKQYVKRFSYVSSGYLPPLGAFFGGFVSQQVIKAITQKYKPLNSVFYMDAEQIIPQASLKENFNIEQILSKKDHRYKGFEIVVGKQLLELIKNSTSFMIGSGAIGCELLKNFAMIGLGAGQKGKITITDPDHIENSNLNRQFLFRQKHISKPKSRTAAASVLLMNPDLKGHISALLERVSESTKNIFSNKFFQSLTLVANALDNVAARRYVDQRCVENKVPLFESGTLGPKGHTQVIIPYLTQSYGSQNDPVEQGQIPHCTLKMFPEETLHCVEWARDIFGKKFSLQPKAFIKIKDPKFKPQKDDIKSLNECIVMATKGPKNFEDCIAYAVTKFYKYFRDDVMQLIHTYPLDAKTKNGEPFWKLPKRPPTPIMKIDPQNILHCTFVASMAALIAKIYKIPYPKNFREEKERRLLGKEALKIKIPDFVPSDEKAKQILKETAEEKKENKMQQQEQKQTQMNSTDKSEQQLFKQFVSISQQLQVVAEQFEKDNDQNGHIDFIYAMANLRANNYKLDEMDWITTKLKAGRIVPALATTTTCVGGLQTLQMCKYIRKLKLQSMKNSFLNLAVPSLQMSEPGAVQKIKLTDKVEVNLWDRWEISCKDSTTFGEVFNELKQKYQLNPIGVLQGMSRIDTSKTQEGKKQFLSSKLLDRLDKEGNNIDIVVLFTKNEQQQKLIEGVPPVRLKFQFEKSA